MLQPALRYCSRLGVLVCQQQPNPRDMQEPLSIGRADMLREFHAFLGALAVLIRIRHWISFPRSKQPDCKKSPTRESDLGRSFTHNPHVASTAMFFVCSIRQGSSGIHPSLLPQHARQPARRALNHPRRHAGPRHRRQAASVQVVNPSRAGLLGDRPMVGLQTLTLAI